VNHDAPSIDEIFSGAMERESPEARANYLDEVCGSDLDMRRRVERLLDAQPNVGSFLDSPAAGSTMTLPPPQVMEAPGTVIGPYKLLEQIGEGGMGIVYMAEQTQPVRRKVALKIIKPGMDTKQVIARFEAERQALAMMDHPNIAKVLDAGATESGRPYFVMELVRGIPITEYCDQHRMTIPQRLDLFMQVCQAVQHAHQKGVIHRDIKPGNVLVTSLDGVPLPRVIDFGIAKATGQSLTDKTLFTGFAQLIGTPLYMSPEQAELSAVDIDTRSDIYSLGVLLYELLTGTTPFDHGAFRTAALDEVRRIIREEEPPKPSTRNSVLCETSTTVSANRQTDARKLNLSLRGELDWIVMKALEKDPRRRYDTASAFSADIARYRSQQPVEAGPPSAWYRFRKFAQRNRKFLTTAAIVLTSSAVVAGMWSWSARRLDRANRAVEQSKNEVQRQSIAARHHRYAADIRQAHQLAQNGVGRTALELLHKYRPVAGEEDVRSFAWYYLMRLCHGERRTLRGHKGSVYHAGFSPDGKTLVSCGEDGTVRFWDVATGQSLRTIPAQDQAGEVNSAEFSADGRTLVTASDDGKVRLWNLATYRLEATIPAHQASAYAGFAPDGRRLISAGRRDRLVKLWDLATYQPLVSIKASEKDLENVVFSPDGRTLATVGEDGNIKLWNSADLSPTGSLFVSGGPVYGLAFSADRTRIATGDVAGNVRVCDRSGFALRNEFRDAQQHTADIQSVAFLAGDRMIVSAGGYGILKLWDSATGKCLGSLLGHTDKIWGVSISPDGTTLATASSDGTVKLWDARPTRQERTLLAQTALANVTMAFTPDGQTLIVALSVGREKIETVDGTSSFVVDESQEVSGFDVNTGTQRFQRCLDRAKNRYFPSLIAGGALAIFASPGFPSTMWEVATGKHLATIGRVAYIHAAWDHFLLVKRPPKGPIELVDAATGLTRHVLQGTDSWQCWAFSPTGEFLAFGDHDQLVIWDVATNRESRRRRMNRPLTTAVISPDATILAIGEKGADVQLWDVGTLELRGTLRGHSDAIHDLSFSPDGRTLVSGSKDGTVKLWDVTAGEELLTLPEPFKGAVSQPHFAPDGRTLAVLAGGAGKIQLYLLPTALPAELDSEEGP
jgi:eukaryotic-like serine/threonine-protein kinase